MQSPVLSESIQPTIPETQSSVEEVVAPQIQEVCLIGQLIGNHFI